MLEWNVTKSFDISHNTPHFFRFQFPEKMPNFDEPESVNYEGIYQTISSFGALIVKRQGSFQQEFIVVLVVHPNNEKCMRWNPFSLPNDNLVQTRSNKGTSPLKSTSLFVSSLAKAEEELSLGPISKLFYWMLPSLIAIGIVVAAYVALTFRHKWIRQTPISRPAQPLKKERVKRGLLTNNYIKNLHVSKFTKGKKSIYVVGIVALFYLIPTIQFAAYYFRVGTSTGNLDLCYYNFRCAQPIWYFLDFNHLFSNLPYMIFGLLFCLIVKVHESKLNGILELHQANNQIELGPIVHQTQDGVEAIELGIPPNFGMFKTLGIALFLEGVLSASYHLCPNQATFQFVNDDSQLHFQDTCFMYVIAVLSTVLIYQQRHPRWFNSNHTFGTLGCMLFLTFVGLLLEAVVTSENRSIYMFTLGTCFWLFQLGVTLLVCFNYIFVGVLDERQRPVNDGNIFRHVWRRDTWKMENLHSHRLVYPTISILITLTLGFVWYFCQLTISDYLLYLLIAKLICSVTYYFIMKFTFTIGSVCRCCVVLLHASSSRVGISPAESRAKNRACVDLFWIGEYPYDSHDLWHFLTAAALFLAFNGLLILDDDLVATPWTDISVF
ncbi:SID1 transmembrane family member 1 [Orchesella cincta]|uniref:SID1 transmembrane family member 1 n=1 Tax=Orchesella cincta TaxID=48709 RepID=A0A1D2M4S3_ORCCI|nr:SID1 transmembrane family member 1 [Orchesella cincta]